MKEIFLLISMTLYGGEVEKLGANKFISRERAQAKLISAGYLAIPAVLKASNTHKDFEIKKRCNLIIKKYYENIFSGEPTPRIWTLCLKRAMNYDESYTEPSVKITVFRTHDLWGFASVYSPKRNLLGIISENIMYNYYPNEDDFKNEYFQMEATERIVYRLCIDNPFPADIMKKLIKRMQHLDKNWEFGD